jgi:hypothetical protein
MCIRFSFTLSETFETSRLVKDEDAELHEIRVISLDDMSVIGLSHRICKFLFSLNRHRSQSTTLIPFTSTAICADLTRC